jgi:hypothetical protein
LDYLKVGGIPNSISTAQASASKVTFAGRSWFYHFREMRSVFSEAKCAEAASRLLERYSKLTKNWDAGKNSEWICRLFMAAKLIMGATLHVNSLYYAEEHNLRVVVPYLRYYSVLSLLRAVCFSLPEPVWNNGNLFLIGHEKAISITLSYLMEIDKNVGDSAEREIRELKAERELISYRAPSSGDDQIRVTTRFLPLCTLLAELAQFNSELFESSLKKHGNPNEFQFLPEYGENISDVAVDGHFFGDPEDGYRLTYLVQNHPCPANLMHLMTEGHVDDFFKAWASTDKVDGVFDPHEMNSIIFDIP